MKSAFFSKNLPHFIAVAVFLIIASIYGSPYLNGKRISTHDYNTYTAIAKANNDYQKEHDRLVFWNNNLFSGMPTYAVSTAKHAIFLTIYKVLSFNGAIPINMIFWYLLGFYILLNILRVNPWISMLGALMFGFSSYYFIIIAAGHFTKAMAIGFMGPILGGVLLAFERKKPWAGMFLMTFFLALQILTNHVQITYYTGLAVIIYGIFELVWAIKEKYVARFFKTVGILAIGFVIALGINAVFLMTTQEYISYSIRGKSELATKQGAGYTSGLDKDYATSWSYGIDETFTLLIPNVKGGASYSALSEDSETYEIIKNNFGRQNANEICKTMPTYFGDQAFTAGPVYVGAIVVFLFVFGLLIVKGKLKWWLLTLTIFSIVLAWGRNFEWLTHLFLDYIPGYNKFRTVSMILVIAETAMPLLAILSIAEIVKNKIDKRKLLSSFYIALGVTAFVTIIFIISPSITGLSGENKSEVRTAEMFASYFPNEAEYANAKEQFKNDFILAITQDRADLVRKDATRSLVFILLAAVLVYLLINKKLKPNLVIASLAVLVLADMWTINRRYLNDDNFVSKRKYEVPFDKTPADSFILADNDLHYRVCNLSGGASSVFNDGSTSYYHKSIGGYSGAKMRRYQEVHDSVLFREMYFSEYIIREGIKNRFEPAILQQLFEQQARTPIMNMLNTKYIIYSPENKPIINKNALGNAWFVDSIIKVESPDEEIAKLNSFSPEKEAIVEQRFNEFIKDWKNIEDSTATITLKDVAPDYVVYESETNSEQLAVFSEIYYPHDWKVTIDGNEASHFRANYILRAMIVPAGKHEIKFEFISEVYKKGVIISCTSSILLFLMMGIGLFFEIRKKKQDKISS
ncbi:MAG TPA: hypothetical protein PLW23_06375 [Bacteroidales bacterium]|nr:hypothetical protein [Bacteroidales bacterium]